MTDGIARGGEGPGREVVCYVGVISFHFFARAATRNFKRYWLDFLDQGKFCLQHVVQYREKAWLALNLLARVWLGGGERWKWWKAFLAVALDRIPLQPDTGFGSSSEDSRVGWIQRR